MNCDASFRRKPRTFESLSCASTTSSPPYATDFRGQTTLSMPQPSWNARAECREFPEWLCRCTTRCSAAVPASSQTRRCHLKLQSVTETSTSLFSTSFAYEEEDSLARRCEPPSLTGRRIRRPLAVGDLIVTSRAIRLPGNAVLVPAHVLVHALARARDRDRATTNSLPLSCVQLI